jgi:hypothetical protein
MKYFFDTEFIESSERKTIDLISIGIVAEDGRKYYAISTEFDASLASEWVKENVLSKLPPRPGSFNPAEASPRIVSESKAWKSRQQIREEILKFTSQDVSPIEFWAGWADYDWVVFCWLFGNMIDLPEGYPFYCNDVIQWKNQLGLKREFLPEKPKDAHNALADALWVKEAYDALKKYSDNQNRRRSDGKPIEFKDGSH